MSEHRGHEGHHGHKHGSPSAQEHREAGPEKVRVAVLTISDTRTPEDDTGGDTVVEHLEAAGHEVVSRRIVRDEFRYIRKRLVDSLASKEVDAIITTGGTGISGRDTTYEVAEHVIRKRLDGFGELFRMLSYEEIGSAAMMSRAIAGEAAGKFLVCLPGSRNAVRLGMEKLIIPEISHIVFELKKHEGRKNRR